MYTRTLSGRLAYLSVSAVCLILIAPAQPLAAASLKPPVIQGDRSVRLELTNATASTTYTVHASTNLISWFAIGSGSAANGLLVLQHAGASNYSTLFYRSVESSPASTVLPALDTNALAVTLALTNGARAQLYTTNNIRMELIVPPTPLPEPALISMTLVTNLSGLPFSRGSIGAVYLEPSELHLWGAARLEITLPAGIDRRQLIAYRFEKSGARFTGMPSQTLTNRIVIPITELGGYGVSLATTQEMAAFFAQPIIPATAPSLALAASAQAVEPDECDLEEKQIADEAKREISAAIDARQKELARRLTVARQQQLSGEESDAAQIFADALRQGCEVYNELIAPRWGEARQNCALSKVLALFTLGMERQRQLLGVSDDESCTSLSTVANCVYFQNCVEEIRDCCRRGSKRRQRIAAAFGHLRQTQLLGLDCISNELLQQVIDGCSSNVWNGTFSAVEERAFSTNSTIFVPTSTTITETFADEVQRHFQGQVVESREIDFGQFGKQVDLVVIGNLSAREHSLETYISSSGCPGGGRSSLHRISESEDVGAGPAAYEIRIMVSPDNSYILTGLNVPHPEIPSWLGTGYTFHYNHSVPCQGATRTDNGRSQDEVAFAGPFTPLIQKTGATTNQIGGIHIVNQPDANPPGTTTFQWNFHRRRVTGQ
jgi:hypothetical protein